MYNSDLSELNNSLLSLWSVGLISTSGSSDVSEPAVRRQEVCTIFLDDSYVKEPDRLFLEHPKVSKEKQRLFDFVTILDIGNRPWTDDLAQIVELSNGRKLTRIRQEIKPIFYKQDGKLERVVTLHMEERVAVYHGKYSPYGIPQHHPLNSLGKAIQNCDFKTLGVVS